MKSVSYLLILSLYLSWIPTPSYAKDVEKKAEDSPSLKELVLTPEAGDAYVEQTIERINQMPGGREKNFVHITHLGSDSDPQLMKIIRRLDRAGIRVRGTVLTEEEFVEALEDYGSDLGENATEAALLNTDTRSLTQKMKEKFRSHFSLSSIRDRVGKLTYWFKRGITFVEHVYETHPDGTLVRDEDGKKLRRFDDHWKPMAIKTALLANVYFSGAMILGAIKREAPMPWEEMSGAFSFGLSNIVLGLWVYVCIRHLSELISFKSQWRIPFWDTKRAKGEQLVTDRSETNSRIGYAVSSILQEWLILALLLPCILGGFSNVSGTDWFNGALNGVLSAFAYQLPEQIAGAFDRRARAAKEVGDLASFKSFAKVSFITMALWNWILYPLMKNGQLLLSGDMQSNSELWAAVPFIVVGTAGAAYEVWKNRGKILQGFRSFIRRINPMANRDSCPSILSIHSSPEIPEVAPFSGQTP